MNSAALLLATAALGVDWGVRQTDDGRAEYLIQIEPSFIRSFENGQDVVSELPPEARGVRRIRVSVGNKALPRDPVPPPREAPRPAELPASATEPIKAPGRVQADRPPPPAAVEAREPPAAPRRLEQPAGEGNKREDAGGVSSPSDAAPRQEAGAAGDDEPAKGVNLSWLVAAIVALCASLGGNFYQGWNLASARRRYYQLVERLGAGSRT